MPETSRYEDIINLPHHQSSTRQPMSRLNRAAQFAPFAALTGYDAAIAEAARQTDERIELSEAEKLSLGAILSGLAEICDRHPRVRITFFQPDSKKDGGSYLTLTEQVRKVRIPEKEIVLMNGRIIPFGDIVNMETQQKDSQFSEQ